MPHDKNGTLLKVGDFVKHKTYIADKEQGVVAQVLAINAGTTCNVYLGVPYPTTAIRQEYANADKLEKIDLE